jgi:hypothetical protein
MGVSSALQDGPRKLVHVKTGGGLRWTSAAVIIAILISILVSMEHMGKNKPRLVHNGLVTGVIIMFEENKSWSLR